jgi:hypothetical protein
MKKTFAEKQNNVALGVIELYGAKIVPKPDVYFTLTLANGTEAVFSSAEIMRSNNSHSTGDTWNCQSQIDQFHHWVTWIERSMMGEPGQFSIAIPRRNIYMGIEHYTPPQDTFDEVQPVSRILFTV